MIVEMLVATRYDGRKVCVGDTLEIDNATANRWVSKGLAAETTPAEKSLGQMNKEELIAKAAELRVDLTNAKTNEEIKAAIKSAVNPSGV